MNALSQYKHNLRLHRILEMLQKGRMISVNDAAGKLGCSQRTIQRALRMLRQQGHRFSYSTRFRKFTYHKPLHPDDEKND